MPVAPRPRPAAVPPGLIVTFVAVGVVACAVIGFGVWRVAHTAAPVEVATQPPAASPSPTPASGVAAAPARRTTATASPKPETAPPASPPPPDNRRDAGIKSLTGLDLISTD